MFDIINLHFEKNILSKQSKHEVNDIDHYTKEEVDEALQINCSVIARCEKIQPKFVEGTSQYTLLQNRIKAMVISKALITVENVMDKYSKNNLFYSFQNFVNGK